MKGLHLLFLLLCMLYVQKLAAQNAPLFPTDVTCAPDGSLVMTEKGTRRLAVYSPDGKELKAAYKLDAAPTGVAVEGDCI